MLVLNAKKYFQFFLILPKRGASLPCETIVCVVNKRIKSSFTWRIIFLKVNFICIRLFHADENYGSHLCDGTYNVFC